MRPPYLVTAPTEQIVDLDEVKHHLRVDDDSDDTLIQSYIDAAVSFLDGYGGQLGQAIMQQTWAQEFDCWGTYELALPNCSNIQAVGIIDGVETPASSIISNNDALGYFIDINGNEAEKIKVTYDVKMHEADIPKVKMVIYLLVAHWYENREAVTDQNLKETPMAVTALMSNIKVTKLK